MRVAFLAICAAALAAAAVADAGGPPTRDCRSRSEPSSGTLAFNRNDVVIGPVAFSGLRVKPEAVSRHDGVLSRKTGLKVRAGRPVTLVVPDEAGGRVWLAYARESSFADTSLTLSETRFEPCPPRTRSYVGGVVGRVTGFNGGLVFTRRGCYTLEVHVEGRAAPYRGRVPLGVRNCR